MQLNYGLYPCIEFANIIVFDTHEIGGLKDISMISQISVNTGGGSKVRQDKSHELILNSKYHIKNAISSGLPKNIFE